MAKKTAMAKKMAAAVSNDRKLEKVRAESYCVVYSNNADLTTGYYDMRIQFNDIVRADQDNLVVEEKASVIMSLEHARDLHAAIGRGLAEYEARFGGLRQPDQAKPA